MKRIHARELSRRAMLCKTAAASGLAGIFKMAALGQQAGAPAQGQAGRGGAQGFGGRGGVHYGPINKFSSPSGLRIPHNHPNEEEIYLLLRGSGDMVAGLDANGQEVRHPVMAGAAFLFKPGCQVGYYSNAKEGQGHDLMLAVRSMLPRSGRGPIGQPSGGRGE